MVRSSCRSHRLESPTKVPSALSHHGLSSPFLPVPPLPPSCWIAYAMFSFNTMAAIPSLRLHKPYDHPIHQVEE